METYQSIFVGLQTILGDPLSILYLVLGTFGGMIFGAIPGLTGALGVTLMLPFTFSMSASRGLAMLIGIYVGGVSGGLVASVMLNIPGNAAAICTCFDGAPMARKGEPYRALSYGISASFIGGIFSAVCLIIMAPALADVGLMFGTWEYFALGVMGMSVVVKLCSNDMIKGLMGAVLGMCLAMVGQDPLSNLPRFTFGNYMLATGLSSLPTMMGLFAVAELLAQVNGLRDKMTQLKTEEHQSVIPKRGAFKGLWKTVLTSCAIGTGIGIMPGVGQNTAALIAYNQARATSKRAEEFGTGCPEGIVAPEAANNAVCGGALIPMMTLGIPGDMITAVLMAGLIVQGVTPGPLLFTHNIEIVGSIYVSYILACVFMYLLYIVFIRGFIKVLSLPMNYLYPVIMVMCIIGAYTTNNRIFDIWVLLVMGAAGYFLNKLGISFAPIVLGYVLGPTMERNFRTAIMAFKGDVSSVFTRPIAMALLLVAVLMLAGGPLLKELRKLAGKEKTA